MKIKKILSSLVAFSMTMSMVCTTVFADEETNVSGQYNFVYTDKTISFDDGIAAAALDQYEPNDFENPCGLDTIYAKKNPFDIVNASLSKADGDKEDRYGVYACTRDYNDYEIVDEFVVMLGNLSNGDRLQILITENNETVAYGTIDGSLGLTACVSLPIKYNGVYGIYITFAEDSINTEIDYTLLVASRYAHESQTFYPKPSSLYNPNNRNYSESAYININESQAPRSAIVDSIFYYGTLTNNKGGRVSGLTVMIKKDSEEIYGASAASYLKNLTSWNISLVGKWDISFRQDSVDPHTLSNLTFTFDYTYDVLDM